MSGPLEALVARATGGDRRAVEAIVAALQDDLYRLAFRMLGLRADAEDATQEILVAIVTHLGSFRGESAFRTWAWRIAVRHVLRHRKTMREEVASFETIEMLIAQGDEGPAMPASLGDPEKALLAEEVRRSCTEGMVLSLDRDHRLAWILAEVFGLSGEDAAAVLEIDHAAYRKRLSRARERFAAWMGANCGLADAKNACRCERQIPVALGFGVLSRESLEYVGHPARERARGLPIAEEARRIESAAAALQHPDYTAPEGLLPAIRAMLASGEFRMFD